MSTSSEAKKKISEESSEQSQEAPAVIERLDASPELHIILGAKNGGGQAALPQVDRSDAEQPIKKPSTRSSLWEGAEKGKDDARGITFNYSNLQDPGVLPVDEQQRTDDRDFITFDELVGEGNEADELTRALQDYLGSDEFREGNYVPGDALDVRSEDVAEYVPEKIGFHHIGSPEEMLRKLEQVGYICNPFIASQISLLLNTELNSISSVIVEGPSGCGKTFLAKSLAKITGAELMVLQCHTGMRSDHLIEKPSEAAVAKAMAGQGGLSDDELIPQGIISRAFAASQDHPVILLVDEIDKAEKAIDTFFLGPIQDAVIRSDTRGAIRAKRDNLLIIFTKNMERELNDALMRRAQMITMEYIKPELEEKLLSPHCAPRLVQNLVKIADLMRNCDEAYVFDRAPAPEELLKTGKYVTHLLRWHITDYGFIGKNIWYMLAKSEKDRETLERFVRHHPHFADPLVPDNRGASSYQIFARLGRFILDGIVDDPDIQRRKGAYKPAKVGLTDIGEPEVLARKLEEVGYQCMPFVAAQIALLMNTPSNRVRGLLLEGPSGCGKSFMAKSLAKITGAELMVMSCYEGMNTQHLLEYPSEAAMAQAKAGILPRRKEDLISLGVISRAYLKSQSQPVILLVDEIDKVGTHVDTFFLGPLQDGTVWLESRPPIDANIDNLLVIFTKNMNRTLDQALLRRLHPITMTYLDSTLERKILSQHCVSQLVVNLVAIADRMRESNGSYQFERPPAPEELLTAGHYVSKLLEWGQKDFAFIGKSVWSIIAKSEHDRAVLDHMLRFHPDFIDPLHPDGKNAPKKEIQARFGRLILRGLVRDPDAKRRAEAWKGMLTENN